MPVIDLDAADQATDSRAGRTVGVQRSSVQCGRTRGCTRLTRCCATRVGCWIRVVPARSLARCCSRALTGQWYTLTVEAMIAVADPDYVRDSLAMASQEVTDAHYG